MSGHDSSKEKVIEVRSLTKNYGALTAVNHIDLDVYQGEVFGFLGPNGAGKTTTIRSLMGQISIQEGYYSLLGVQNDSITPEIFRSIGYLSGESYLFDNYTPTQLFTYLAKLNGNSVADWYQLAERFHLDMDKKIKELSSGNKQKVALIQAFMKNPKLLILDEPTTGLDPILQKEFEKLVFERVEAGSSVFLSSHIMSEVENLCDRVAIIRNGEIIKVATIRELHEEMEIYKVNLFSAERDKVEALGQKSRVQDMTLSGRGYEFVYKGDANSLLEMLTPINIEDLKISEPSLEQIFLKYYEATENE